MTSRTPTAVMDTSLHGAIATAATMSGWSLRLGKRDSGYCIERRVGTQWIPDTEIFRTPEEVRAFAIGFSSGFEKGNTQ